jgi:ribonuclease Z
MKLHILGTGNGGALNCYNTCFAIENNKEYLLVDGGGGNQILNQLKLANIDITKIHHVFLSHNHTDHILGVIWVLRNVCQKMKFGGSYVGNLNIYGSDESMKVLKLLIELLFPMIKQFKDRIIFNVVNDKQSIKINDMDLTFFDIHANRSTKWEWLLKHLCQQGQISTTRPQPKRKWPLLQTQASAPFPNLVVPKSTPRAKSSSMKAEQWI